MDAAGQNLTGGQRIQNLRVIVLEFLWTFWFV
jgi:hypothetical protein